jgi:hypothetical protein
MATLSGIYRLVDRHKNRIVETRFVESLWVTTTANVTQGAWAPLATIESQKISHRGATARLNHTAALGAVRAS